MCRTAVVYQYATSELLSSSRSGRRRPDGRTLSRVSRKWNELRAVARRTGVRRVLEGVLVVALFLGVRALTLRGVASGEAPALAGRDVRGQRVSLEDWRGQAVAVDFWATWCEVCRVESGSVASLARSGKVITVATSSGDAATVRAEMEKEGVSFPVVVVDPTAQSRRRGASRAFRRRSS